MTKKASVKERILRVFIAIAAVLLIIAVCLWILHIMNEKRGSSSSTENNIQGTDKQIIRLTGANSSEDIRFALENIFPGDSETKVYSVELLDSGIKAVRFGVKDNALENKLYEVLNISITAGETLYNGLVKDMPKSLSVEVEDHSEPIEFEITVSVDTSVGNEFQGLEATLDLMWWIEDGDYVAASSGTDVDSYCLWCWILPIVIVLLIIAIIVIAIILHELKKQLTPIIPPTPDIPDTPVTPATPVTDAPASPKKESTSRNKKYTAEVTLDSIMKAYAPHAVINMASLKAKGLVAKKARGYKVLRGTQPLDRPLIIYANSFSSEATRQIKMAGGEVHYL